MIDDKKKEITDVITYYYYNNISYFFKSVMTVIQINTRSQIGMQRSKDYKNPTQNW